VVLARHREVDEGARVFAESPVLAVFHHADDLKALAVRAAPAQVFADGVLPWPEASREVFVDDREARLLLIVPHREIAALRHPNAHCLEITRPDIADRHSG